SITAYIEKISQDIYALWKNKEALAEEKFKGKTEVKREQQIYYDTAGVMEQQVQTFSICAECAGVNRIDSQNDQGSHNLVITLPRKDWQACINKAYAIYNSASNDNYSNVYFLERVNDEYRARGRSFEA